VTVDINKMNCGKVSKTSILLYRNKQITELQLVEILQLSSKAYIGCIVKSEPAKTSVL